VTAFERWSVWLGSLLTAVTGAGYFWAKYLVRPADPWAVINHPLQPWLLKLHILVAAYLVFAVGLVALRHVWAHLRSGVTRGRRTGVSVALAVGPMVVTGYLIQAVTGPAWLEVLAITHLVTGGVYTVGLGLHQLVLHRRARPASGEARYPPRPAVGTDGIAGYEAG